MIRAMLVAIALLMLAITTSSAYIRLQQAGISCADWPQCYAQAAPEREVVPTEGPLFWARALHRIAATIVGVLVLVVIVLGWSRFDRGWMRAGAIALALLTMFLAWLGSYTPSTAPIVTLANVVAGVAMVAIAVALARGLGAGARDARPGSSALGWILVLLLLQVALGAVLGASYPALACAAPSDCWTFSFDALWRAVRGLGETVQLPIASADLGDAARRALVAAHRYLGLVLLAIIVAWVAARQSRAVGLSVIVLVLVQIVLGALLSSAPTLATAVAHNGLAAIVVALIAQAWAVRGGPDGSAQPARYTETRIAPGRTR